MNSLVLASSSPRRIDLLRQAGYEFVVANPSRPEIPTGFLTANELTLWNAHRKASEIAQQHADQVVLSADTVVALGAVLFGKPTDENHAEAMLAELAGRTHRVVTSIVVSSLQAQRRKSGTIITEVTFKPLSRGQIAEYVHRVSPLDKAGAYSAQEDAGNIIEQVRGSFTNVVGLPMEIVPELLAQFGVFPKTGARSEE
ncbi:MAG: septum formation protein Maf [Verrucomicrobia bacterium]|nr:septum formation protein Maf [Verrucomicrobiota bacterium]